MVMEIHLIYASTSGNVEIVMETIAKILKDKQFKIFLSRAEKTLPKTVKNNHRFIFGTSTWDHGRLNPFFDNLAQKMQSINCHNKQAAFIGLGDRRYEPVLFCDGIEKIRKLWLTKGGKQISSTLKINGEPYAQLNTIVAPWAALIAQAWTNNHAPNQKTSN